MNKIGEYKQLESVTPSSQIGITSEKVVTEKLMDGGAFKTFIKSLPSAEFYLVADKSDDQGPLLVTTAKSLGIDTHTGIFTLGVVLDVQGNLYEFDHISETSLQSGGRNLDGIPAAIRTMRNEAISAAQYNYGPGQRNTRRIEYKGNIYEPRGTIGKPVQEVTVPAAISTADQILMQLAANG